jgi:HSP20 family protein
MEKARENTQATKDDQSLASRENALTREKALASLGIPLLSPFGLMRRFFEELDRVGSGIEAGWSPALEVFERDGQLVVRAEVPGLDKDQVKVEVVDDQLVISGEKNRENEERGEGFYRSERSYGSFCRVVALPEGVDPERAVATFNNGVLEITMPAPAHSKPRRIEIRDGSAAPERTPQREQQPSASEGSGAAAH